MADFKDKLNNSKDKIVGEVKEKVGKVTGNEELELKGKIQSAKSDIKEKINKDDIGKDMHEIKEDIAEKINNIIDKNKDKKYNKEDK